MRNEQGEKEQLNSRQWRDLLFEDYDYDLEGKNIFPVNPPRPAVCEKLQYLLEECYFQAVNGIDPVRGTIEVFDHGIASYNLPMLVVKDQRGKIRSMKEFTLQELLLMPIEINMNRDFSDGQFMALFCLYWCYPLRVKHQKKRDSVALLLNVLCQKNQVV